MEFNKRQLNIINAKSNGFNIIKGKLKTGKTVTALSKVSLLLNSYCIEKSDSILMILNSEECLKKTKKLYELTDSKKYYQESFFEKSKTDHFKMQTIDNLAFSLFSRFKKRNNNIHKLINNNIKKEILTDIIETINSERLHINKYNCDLILEFEGNKLNKNGKFLKEENITKCIDEIKYIKSFNYSFGEYLICDRKKYSNITIRKNSQDRIDLYILMNIYNDIMKIMNYIDSEDIYIIAEKEASSQKNEKYTHVFIENAQEYTRVQLKIIEAMFKYKSYSNFTYIICSDFIENKLSYLNFEKNLGKMGYDFKGRTKMLIEQYNKKTQYDKDQDENNKDRILQLDKKLYIDLKHNRDHVFVCDDNNSRDLYISEAEIEEKAEKLREIPMYNEIAAGKPILMNDSLEDIILLPEEWLRGSKNTFILRIKGDSMINKNINDGDLVVLDSTKSVNDNDIVAVEFGNEATLKTFKNEKTRLIFKPENDKYEPIIVTENDDFNILGVAVGIIKNN